MMQAVSPCSTNYYYLPPSTRSTVSYTATISPSRLNCLIRWARTFRDIRHEQSFRQPGSPPQGAYGLGRAGSLGLRTRLPSTGSKASVRWQAGTICKGSDACISRNWNCGHKGWLHRKHVTQVGGTWFDQCPRSRKPSR